MLLVDELIGHEAFIHRTAEVMMLAVEWGTYLDSRRAATKATDVGYMFKEASVEAQEVQDAQWTS